jgi:hypothetical protein
MADYVQAEESSNLHWSRDGSGAAALCFREYRIFFWNFGGRDRVRTCDPLLAKQVLSQLSYTPILATILV